MNWRVVGRERLEVAGWGKGRVVREKYLGGAEVAGGAVGRGGGPVGQQS